MVHVSAAQTVHITLPYWSLGVNIPLHYGCYFCKMINEDCGFQTTTFHGLFRDYERGTIKYMLWKNEQLDVCIRCIYSVNRPEFLIKSRAIFLVSPLSNIQLFKLEFKKQRQYPRLRLQKGFLEVFPEVRDFLEQEAIGYEIIENCSNSSYVTIR